ncbi:MAG: T9SS type A sorting domain-containing protein [Bacteroidales bacterium]
MKRLFTFFTCFFLILLTGKAQDIQLDWITQGTGPNIIFGEGVSVDPDGNAYITGYFNTWLVIDGDTTEVESDKNTMFFARVSPENDVQWLVTAESDSIQGVTGFKSYYKNGYVYLMGDLRGIATFHSMDFTEQQVSANEYRTMYIAKYATNGVLEWVRTITTDNSIGMVMTGGAHDLVVDNSGAVYFSTQFRNSLNIAGTEVPDPTPEENLYNAIVAKLDANGAYQWHWSTTNSGSDLANAINIRNDDELFFTVRYADTLTVEGNVAANPGSGGFALVEFDLMGSYQWHKAMSTESSISTGVRCFGLTFDNDGDIFLGGSFRTNIYWDQENSLLIENATRSDGFLIKIDGEDKSWMWGKAYGDPEENADIRSLVYTSENTFLAGGNFKGEMILNDNITLISNENSTDGYWAVLDTDGLVSDAFGFGGNSNEFLSQLAVSSDNDVYMIGRFQNDFMYDDVEFSAWGSFDLFLIKLGEPSQDASLSSIELDGEPLVDFDPGIMSYDIIIDDIDNIPVVTATTADENASYEVLDPAQEPGNDDWWIVEIQVTAEDPLYVMSYYLWFREISDDATLTQINIDGVVLSGFDPDVLHYEVELAPETSDVPFIEGIPASPWAGVETTQAENINGGEEERTATITVTAESGTELIYTVLFTLDDTSVSDLSNNSFSIYPNPAKDKIYVELSAGFERIRLFNITGLQVMEVAGNSEKAILDVENLPSGIYLLKLSDTEGQIYTQKIVIRN